MSGGKHSIERPRAVLKAGAMDRRLAPTVIGLALLGAVGSLSGKVWAQPAALEPAAVEVPEEAPEVFPPRPKLSLAAGMGATVDSAGFSGGAHVVPAFFAVGGFGDGLAGVDLGAFASSATGRFHAPGDDPVDRLALDGFGVLRPLARTARGSRYGVRVIRTAAIEAGLGVERDGRPTGSGSRFAVHTGARIEFPLTAGGEASELRLRLAVRRAFGLYTPSVSGASAADATSVGDSTEAYAALAVVF
jgi:hypothetical protein